MMKDAQHTDLGGLYEIRVAGKLSKEWSDWFDGFCILKAGGETMLTGQVADQAALHGLLSKIRDLGLPLLLVRRLSSPGEHRAKE